MSSLSIFDGRPWVEVLWKPRLVRKKPKPLTRNPSPMRLFQQPTPLTTRRNMEGLGWPKGPLQPCNPPASWPLRATATGGGRALDALGQCLARRRGLGRSLGKPEVWHFSGCYKAQLLHVICIAAQRKPQGRYLLEFFPGVIFFLLSFCTKSRTPTKRD